MFCHQCEQTFRSEAGAGCASTQGVCGKDALTAELQDLLIHMAKGICQYARRARDAGAPDNEAAGFVLYATFSTLTNVNFNSSRFLAMIQEAARIRDRVKARYEEAVRAAGGKPEILTGPAAFKPADDLEELTAQAAGIGVLAGAEAAGEDAIALRSMILYGLKGVCAYAHHAHVLGYVKPEVLAGVEKTFDYLAGDPTDTEALLAQALELGRLNFDVLELLDAANTGSFGSPEPTRVRVSPVKGKAILVSGHDLKDLAAILDATKDKGVNVYTHGELLPANAYPRLKVYPHLIGNYGGAWQDQQKEFAEFPGPVVVTSNCIIEPKFKYRGRIFTSGPVGWPGVPHLGEGDFGQVVKAALAQPGFAEDAPEEHITIGYGRDATLNAAGAVVEAVKSGAIRHFFLVGGCDGAAPGRSYYTEFAQLAPADTAVLTLGCAKYRFNRQEFGDIGGLPRLLDVGQCNDAYSAVVIAAALAKAFNCEVNELPLSLVISWFEQKAAAVLLTLLALGIKNIRLGPSLPGFLTPSLLGVLTEKFGLQPITSAQADIEAALRPKAA
jgi:hydroxylamine reductase